MPVQYRTLSSDLAGPSRSSDPLRQSYQPREESSSSRLSAEVVDSSRRSPRRSPRRSGRQSPRQSPRHGVTPLHSITRANIPVSIPTTPPRSSKHGSLFQTQSRPIQRNTDYLTTEGCEQRQPLRSPVPQQQHFLTRASGSTNSKIVTDRPASKHVGRPAAEVQSHDCDDRSRRVKFVSTHVDRFPHLHGYANSNHDSDSLRAEAIKGMKMAIASAEVVKQRATSHGEATLSRPNHLRTSSWAQRAGQFEDALVDSPTDEQTDFNYHSRSDVGNRVQIASKDRCDSPDVPPASSSIQAQAQAGSCTPPEQAGRVSQPLRSNAVRSPTTGPSSSIWTEGYLTEEPERTEVLSETVDMADRYRSESEQLRRKARRSFELTEEVTIAGDTNQTSRSLNNFMLEHRRRYSHLHGHDSDDESTRESLRAEALEAKKRYSVLSSSSGNSGNPTSTRTNSEGSSSRPLSLLSGRPSSVQSHGRFSLLSDHSSSALESRPSQTRRNSGPRLSRTAVESQWRNSQRETISSADDLRIRMDLARLDTPPKSPEASLAPLSRPPSNRASLAAKHRMSSYSLRFGGTALDLSVNDLEGATIPEVLEVDETYERDRAHAHALSRLEGADPSEHSTTHATKPQEIPRSTSRKRSNTKSANRRSGAVWGPNGNLGGYSSHLSTSVPTGRHMGLHLEQGVDEREGEVTEQRDTGGASAWSSRALLSDAGAARMYYGSPQAQLQSSPPRLRHNGWPNEEPYPTQGPVSERCRHSTPVNYNSSALQQGMPQRYPQQFGGPHRVGPIPPHLGYHPNSLGGWWHGYEQRLGADQLPAGYQDPHGSYQSPAFQQFNSLHVNNQAPDNGISAPIPTYAYHRPTPSVATTSTSHTASASVHLETPSLVLNSDFRSGEVEQPSLAKLGSTLPRNRSPQSPPTSDTSRPMVSEQAPADAPTRMLLLSHLSLPSRSMSEDPPKRPLSAEESSASSETSCALSRHNVWSNSVQSSSSIAYLPVSIIATAILATTFMANRRRVTPSAAASSGVWRAWATPKPRTPPTPVSPSAHSSERSYLSWITRGWIRPRSNFF